MAQPLVMPLLQQEGTVYIGPGAQKEAQVIGLGLVRLTSRQRDDLERAKRYAMDVSVKTVLQKQQIAHQQNQQKLQMYTQALSLMARVYIGSISFEVREENLKQAFAVFGPIKTINMNYDVVTGHHKGFAFLDFEVPEAALLAQEAMNGKMMGGRNLKVGRPTITTQAQSIIEMVTHEAKSYHRVYVASVHPDLSEQDLRAVFEAFGVIIRVQLAKKPNGIGHRGFGYIEFNSAQAVREAIDGMNNFDLGGQYLQVGRCITPPEALTYIVPTNATTLPTAAAVAAAAVTAKIQAQEVAGAAANKLQYAEAHEPTKDCPFLLDRLPATSLGPNGGVGTRKEKVLWPEMDLNDRRDRSRSPERRRRSRDHSKERERQKKKEKEEKKEVTGRRRGFGGFAPAPSPQVVDPLALPPPSIVDPYANVRSVHSTSLPQPGLAQPGLVQPGFAQPGLVQPSLVQPSLVQPSYGQPGLVQPGLIQPGLVNPPYGQPGLVQPSLVQPGLVQPGLVHPNVSQPGLVQLPFGQPPPPPEPAPESSDSDEEDETPVQPSFRESSPIPADLFSSAPVFSADAEEPILEKKRATGSFVPLATESVPVKAEKPKRDLISRIEIKHQVNPMQRATFGPLNGATGTFEEEEEKKQEHTPLSITNGVQSNALSLLDGNNLQVSLNQPQANGEKKKHSTVPGTEKKRPKIQKPKKERKPKLNTASAMAAVHKAGAINEKVQQQIQSNDEASLSSMEHVEIRGNDARHMLMHKLMRTNRSAVIVLKNVATEVDEFLEDDMREECGKYGTVTNVVIVEEKEASQIRIFVRFADPTQADACLKVMNGRWFDGRQIEAKAYDQILFEHDDFSG